MKTIVILGSTGSIGTNTFDIVDRFPEEFCVAGLTAGSNDRKTRRRRSASSNPRVVALSECLCCRGSGNVVRICLSKFWPGKKALIQVALCRKPNSSFPPSWEGPDSFHPCGDPKRKANRPGQ